MNKKEKIVAMILTIVIVITLLLINSLIWYGILSLFTWLFHIQAIVTFKDGFIVGTTVYLIIRCFLEVCNHE